MFHVASGTPALLQRGDNKPFPFFTRKNLIFLPRERVKSAPNKLAFRRSGYTIILDSNNVSIKESVISAVEGCLVKLQTLIQNRQDSGTVVSLVRAKKLTTSQTILGALLISKYRWLLPEMDSKLATSILTKPWRKPRHGWNHNEA